LSIGPTAAQVAEAHALVAKLGSKTKAAIVLGIPRTTLHEWVSGNVRPKDPLEGSFVAGNEIIARLNAENATLKETLKNATRPKYSIRTDNISRGERLKVVCIGDAHDSPHLDDKSRFVHIGKHINAVRPDVVVQIGDFMTADSVSTHAGNHTIEGKHKPTFNDDLNSFRLALDAFNDGLGSFNPEKHVTLGNHELRLLKFEQEHPETEGMIGEKLHLALSDRGWKYSPYGEATFYGGVAFLHCAINRMGKSFGGKNSELQVANELLTDCVVGHSHIKRVHKAPKLHHRHVTVVNVGCALPEGYIEPYAKVAQTGWSYGVMTLTIKDNHIQDDEWVSMATLAERYA
jgi:hypothetical protein